MLATPRQVTDSMCSFISQRNRVRGNFDNPWIVDKSYLIALADAAL